MTEVQTTPTNPIGTLEMALEMGLNEAEFAQCRDILGRQPTLTEVGMFSVMWSEHCGYKFSRPILRLISNYRQMADEGTMENAGVIPLGDGLGVVFKMESHNHPSAVEPVQGAATGVGGILRDIFTMGARPIASLDSIRFGPLSDDRTKFLFKGVVEGIAFYGNCVGVPTVGGEVVFHPAYTGNPLVNAMAIGLVREDQIARATAKGVGNPVLLVGSRTGRDGIHGATFASVELTEASESRKSNVQCGDPFTEKLLIEATLEALATGHITGIQDFGAAGLTCSTCETSAKAGTGMRIDVLKVPRREEGKPVIGICNGFQILTEAHLLPGALHRNEGLHFLCQPVYLRVENNETMFTRAYTKGQVIQLPIAHNEGNFFADAAEVRRLEDKHRVVFRYCDPLGQATEVANVNGSVNSIAGIINEAGNILGMMPHPERACEALLGSEDGRGVFESLLIRG